MLVARADTHAKMRERAPSLGAVTRADLNKVVTTQTVSTTKETVLAGPEKQKELRFLLQAKTNPRSVRFADERVVL